MKILIFSVVSTLILQLQPVLAATPDEEVRFVAAAKQAFQKHDADGLMAITCWDRVPDQLKESARQIYARDAKQDVTDIKLTKPDTKKPDLMWKDKDGISYRSNLAVVKQLVITFAPGGHFKDGTYPVGEKKGKLYLLEPAPVN